MRILLLGGTGLLSGAAREAFLGAGHDVCVLTRGERPPGREPGLEILRGDRRDETSLARVLARRQFDCAVDFLAFESGDVGRLLAVPSFSPGRLVVISSGQVYLVTAAPNPPFREADADAPLMPEPSPGTRDHAEWAYGMGKRAVEAELRAEAGRRGLDALALRLPVVQGESDGFHSRRLWAWLERFRDGGPVLLPEDGTQRVRFVHAADAARALVALASGRQWPAHAALNLAQPDEGSLREFLEAVAHAAGVQARWVAASGETLTRAGLRDTCAPYWGRWCSRPDPGAAIAALGFTPRTVAEYLPGVVGAHLADPPGVSHPGYARRADELALAERLGR